MVIDMYLRSFGISTADEVIIVEKKYSSNVPKEARVVFLGDKRGLDEARQVCIESMNGYESNFIDGYDEYIYENKGFKLDINGLRSLSSRYNDMKTAEVSLIAPDNKKFSIEVNLSFLLMLISEATMNKGVIVDDLVLIKGNEGWGLTKEDMELYTRAQAGKEARDTLKNKGTTKFVKGNVYGSLTKTEVYLGDTYIWSEVNYNYTSAGRSGLTLKLLKEPKKEYVIFDNTTFDNMIRTAQAKSLEELLDVYSKNYKDMSFITYLNHFSNYFCFKGSKGRRVDYGKKTVNGKDFIVDKSEEHLDNHFKKMREALFKDIKPQHDGLNRSDWGVKIFRTGTKENPWINMGQKEFKRVHEIMGTNTNLRIIDSEGNILYENE